MADARRMHPKLPCISSISAGAPRPRFGGKPPVRYGARSAFTFMRRSLRVMAQASTMERQWGRGGGRPGRDVACHVMRT